MMETTSNNIPLLRDTNNGGYTGMEIPLLPTREEIRVSSPSSRLSPSAPPHSSSYSVAYPIMHRHTEENNPIHAGGGGHVPYPYQHCQHDMPPVPEPEGPHPTYISKESEPQLPALRVHEVASSSSSPSSSSSSSTRIRSSITDPQVQQELVRPLEPEPVQPIAGPFAGASRVAHQRDVEDVLRASRADREGFHSNIRDLYQLRQAEALGTMKDRSGTQGLQIDPSIHDMAPLSSIIPPARSLPSLPAVASASLPTPQGGGADKKEEGYQIADYKMSGQYSISEYKSIYD